MRFIIYFETVIHKEEVVAHLWDIAGNIWDIPGERVDSRNFLFNVDIETDDIQGINLKFHFPGEAEEWEADDFVRQITIPDVSALWTFEYSSRYLLQAPEGPQVLQIKFKIITKNKFAGGRLLAWNPAARDIPGNKEFFAETSRDSEENISLFLVSVRPWMGKGFHFKMAGRTGEIYEPDSCIRVWRPSDGNEILYKSGRVHPYPQAKMREECRDRTSEGEPYGNQPLADDRQQRMRQGKSTALKESPTSDEEKAMQKKCEAKTKNGNMCKSWAMDNGFCRRHGGETASPAVPAESEKKEKSTDQKPAPPQKTSGAKKTKPIAETCEVITSRGTPCKLPAVANGQCRRHQSKPAPIQNPPRPEQKTTVQKKYEAETTSEGLLATWSNIFNTFGEIVADLLLPKDFLNPKKKSDGQD